MKTKMSKKPCFAGEGLKKGAWTPQEDKKLITYIQEHGEGGWRDLPRKAGLKRCGKSCRLRWSNYLKPDIKRGEFSYEEEQIVMMLHASRGNRWSVIARHLPLRTDNEIKNYWNTNLKKRLIDQGIDPVTHKPLASKLSPATPKTSDCQNDSSYPEEQSHSATMFLKSPSSSSCNLLELSSKTGTNGGTLGSKKRSFKRSMSFTSQVLNKVATRASSIGKILSTSIEGTSIRSSCLTDQLSLASQFQMKDFGPSSQPYEHITDHMEEDIRLNFDLDNSEYDISQLLEEIIHNEDDEAKTINQDLLISDVSSTSLDEDNMMGIVTDWSNYMFDHSNFTYDTNQDHYDDKITSNDPLNA